MARYLVTITCIETYGTQVTVDADGEESAREQVRALVDEGIYEDELDEVQRDAVVDVEIGDVEIMAEEENDE